MVSLYHWRGNNKIDEKFFLEFLKKNKKDPIINNNKIYWCEKNIFY
jgi:hypothetical protein